jgi:hypothetical protein
MQAQYMSMGNAVDAIELTRILETLHNWMAHGGGPSDLLDDPELHSAWTRFIDQIQTSRHLATLRPLITALHKLTQVATSRPAKHLSTGSAASRCPPSFGYKAPVLDDIEAQHMVNGLDEIAGCFMSQVTEADVITAVDILEVQLVDRALFPSKDPSIPSEDVAPENIYTLLRSLEPSSLVSTFCARESLWKALPRSLGKLVEVHHSIRRWITSELSAPGIGLKTREQRFQKVLQSIEYCRARAALSDQQELTSFSDPSTPSLVELALIEAIWAPEVRVFARAWQNIATARGSSLESIKMIFSRASRGSSLSARDALVVDAGWLLERVFEVLSLPDTLIQYGHVLVNFDKRRYFPLFSIACISLISRPGTYLSWRRGSDIVGREMIRMHDHGIIT